MESDRIGRPGVHAVVATAFVAVASGCAQFIAEGEQARQGWHEARVVQIGTGESIKRNASLDCRVGMEAPVATARLYVDYQYRSAGGRLHVIAPLPSGATLKVGDLVRVNAKDCSAAPKLR